jgi:hypothetical protein
MTSATIPTAEAPERVNPIARIFGVLFSPKVTFESIGRRPSWLLPTILLCAVSIGAVAAVSYRGVWLSYMRKQVEKSSRFEQLPPEQQQRILATQLRYAPMIGYVEGVVGPLLLVVVVSAIFLGAFNMGMGTKLGFATCLGVVSHAYVPTLISGLLGILIIFLKDPATLDLQNVVASNVGAFMPDGTARWIVSLLGSVDVFSFWEMALLAIGFSAVAPKKLSIGKALGTIIFVWLVYVLLKVGITAAFS